MAQAYASTDTQRGGRVVLASVDKWFGELHVLRDINLTFEPGEVWTAPVSGLAATATPR